MFKWSRPHFSFKVKHGSFCLSGALKCSEREPFENPNFITQKSCVVMSGNSAQRERSYEAGLWLVFTRTHMTRKGAPSKIGESCAAVQETVYRIFCIKFVIALLRWDEKIPWNQRQQNFWVRDDGRLFSVSFRLIKQVHIYIKTVPHAALRYEK